METCEDVISCQCSIPEVLRYYNSLPDYCFLLKSIHSFEYQHQTSCLTEHLSSCLSGPLFASFVPQVTSLIKLLFYHCGDLVVDPAAIDQFLLNQIQCKAEVFTKTVRCWDDFRNRLNTNKADLQLCRSVKR